MKQEIELKKEHYIGLIGLLLIFSVITCTSSNKEEQLSNSKAMLIKEEPKHVIGFESLPEVYIGSGTMGSLAAIVHGWRKRDWKLMADYQWNSRHQPKKIVQENNEFYLNKLKLIGFKFGTIDNSSKILLGINDNIWTVVSGSDTISFYTDEKFVVSNSKDRSKYLCHFTANTIESLLK